MYYRTQCDCSSLMDYHGMEAQHKKAFVKGFKMYSIFNSTDGCDMLGRMTVKKLGMVAASVRKIRRYCT